MSQFPLATLHVSQLGWSVAWPGVAFAAANGMLLGAGIALLGVLSINRDVRRSIEYLTVNRLLDGDPEGLWSCSSDDIARRIASIWSAKEHRYRDTILLVTSFLHDLKAPLAGLRHMTIAISTREPQAHTDSPSRLMTSEIATVQARVYQALDFVRLRLDELPVCLEEVHVHDVVAGVVQRTAWAVTGARVTVTGEAVALTDRTIFGRAFENLILNAVRHARSLVDVQVRRGVVVVSDDGPGLSDEVVGRLEREDFRAESSKSLSVGGYHGLGLAAASLMLRSLGGRLAIQSSSASGTTFLLYLGPTATSQEV